MRMSDSSDGAWAQEYRRQLLFLNRERIELAYDKARTHGMDDPAILVLDLQDDHAAELARRTGLSWQHIEQLRAECSSCDVVPTLVVSIPHSAITCTPARSSAAGASETTTPRESNTFRVVAIAAGGNSFADLPLPPDTSFDQR